jgi:hypothetical protein
MQSRQKAEALKKLAASRLMARYSGLFLVGLFHAG